MAGPMTDFASFVGVAGAKVATLAGSPRWQTCVTRAGSRVAAAPVQVATARTIAAYRGDARGFHRDDEWLVFLDGTIENLKELIPAASADPYRSESNDAAIIAWLFAQQGDALCPMRRQLFSGHRPAGER